MNPKYVPKPLMPLASTDMRAGVRENGAGY